MPGAMQGPIDERPRVSVRVMDFEHFKNRYGIDDKYHIIEALGATPQTFDELRDEWNSRQKTANATKSKTSALEDGIPSDLQWIQRVRIQSSIILGYLNYVAGNPGWNIERPRVFFWPFGALSHYYPEMKQHLNVLEERWGEAAPPEKFGYFRDFPSEKKSSEHEDHPVDEEKGENGIKELKNGAMRVQKPTGQPKPFDVTNLGVKGDPDTTTFFIYGKFEKTPANRNPYYGDRDADIDISDPKLDNSKALRHMRCYIQFMEQIILPLEEATKYHLGKSGKITSNELWHLFQIGDVIYAPARSISQQQTTFVITRKVLPGIADDYPDDFKNRGLNIWCYYVDNDGDKYGMVEESFTIDGFEGEKKITDLPVYPLHYAHDYESRHTELEKHGQHFKAMVKEKHVYCQGGTLPDKVGKEAGQWGKYAYSSPEYVDSDVIIDIKEALKQNQDWRLEYGLKYSGVEWWRNGDDKMEICHWSDDKRRELLTSKLDKTQREEGIGTAMLQMWEEDTSPAGPHDIEDEKGKIIRSGSLVLPRRVFAYLLRDRKFASVDVMGLEKIPPQENIFDDLEIDQKKKKPIGQILGGIALSKEGATERQARAWRYEPGPDPRQRVGPLFSITCGDLGITPKEVEEKPSGIFRLANLWDCVLLLDEADIFLARRDSWNLKRNALVSVFLRILEYYSGILFLTTNRVGTMDEAFKSRIHVSLYYQPLTLSQTEKIFEANIEKLKRMEREKEQKLAGTGIKYAKLIINKDSILNWARNYYMQAEITSESAQWNGRQIRNAFQIASSLARYDTAKSALERGKMPSPVLNRKQFEMVADAIAKFDQYMQFATGKADSDHARIEGTRADDVRFSE